MPPTRSSHPASGRTGRSRRYSFEQVDAIIRTDSTLRRCAFCDPVAELLEPYVLPLVDDPALVDPDDVVPLVEGRLDDPVLELEDVSSRPVTSTS